MQRATQSFTIRSDPMHCATFDVRSKALGISVYTARLISVPSNTLATVTSTYLFTVVT